MKNVKYWLGKFNPRDLERYAGRTFVDEKDRTYRLSSDGRFTGGNATNGAKIELIAGLTDEFRWLRANALLNRDPESIYTFAGFDHVFDSLSSPNALLTIAHNTKSELDELIDKYGRPIKPGCRIVVSLAKEEIDRTNRIGFLSGIIKKI